MGLELCGQSREVREDVSGFQEIKHLLVSMSPLPKCWGGVKLSKKRIKKKKNHHLLKSSLRGIWSPRGRALVYVK